MPQAGQRRFLIAETGKIFPECCSISPGLVFGPVSLQVEILFLLMRAQYKTLFVLAVYTFLILLLPAVIIAQPRSESHVDARLISEVKTVKPGGSFWVAVRLKMSDGWHTYWRNPGDAGLKTNIDWRLPQGFSAGTIKWPLPERIVQDSQVIYGYHDTIFLLTEISVAETVPAGEAVFIQADVSWLECAQVCIPGNANVQERLEVQDTQPELNEHFLETFSLARSKMPIAATDWKVSAVVEKKTLIVQATQPDWLQEDLGSILFFPYQANLINNAARQIAQKTGNAYRIAIPLAGTNPPIPDTIRGILVTEEGWRGPGSEKGLEVFAEVTDDLLPAEGSSSGLTSLWLAIVFSFIGGMILNLMPCVLPVLSIKIMGFVNQAKEEHSKSWQHGAVFTMGVLISFWALAALLLIFKAGGTQLGWGFQLQSPAFLIVLSSFLFLFGLSMFGVFEIGTSLTTVAGRTRGIFGFGGSFVSGVTATVVATPCTAPFMGSALGFSLTQPAWVSLLVFTFIGLGMSTPYVLISSFPALLRFVPKPGRWMESLKQFMGFLLVATVLWLLWILGIQAGSNVVILMLSVLLVSALGGWIYGRWGNLAMPKNKRITAATTAVILIVSANTYTLANVYRYAVKQSQTPQNAKGIYWEPYSEESIAQVKSEGTPLFIDFTAAWCLSCQVNERVAFSSREVQNKFKTLGIRSFKADWTSRDEQITKALAEYGRNCVPLYVLYSGKQGEEPQILPEIITPGIVLNALKSIE